MRYTMPRTPFSTPFSDSKKLLEERVRHILSGPQKRPPLPLLVLALAFCFFSVNLVSCQPAQSPETEPVEGPSLLTITPEDTPLRWTADLNHNSVLESLEVTWHEEMFYELTVTESDQIIYTEQAHAPHAGWNSVFLYQKDGEDFLLRYNPYMGQGFCSYSYELFYLAPDGSEETVQENYVSFDINFGSPLHEEFDPDAIAAFMEEINPLLADSILLMNTDYDLEKSFARGNALVDDLWWMDSPPEIFTRDESKPLLENLRDFQEAMILNTPHTRTVNLEIDSRRISLFLQGWATDLSGKLQYERIEVFEGDQTIQTIIPEVVEDPVTRLSRGLIHFEDGGGSYTVPTDPDRAFEGFLWLVDMDEYVDVRDLNFDGASDFGILCETSYNRHHAWFVWDGETEQFRYLASLGWVNLRTDPEKGQVIEDMKDGPRHYDNVYEYDSQGNLILVNAGN